MYSQVINYIRERIDLSHKEIEEGLRYTEFKKIAKGSNC